MKFYIKQQDLLHVPQGYMIAHCISADFALGAGVAKQIDEAYGMKYMLNKLFTRHTNDGQDHSIEWPSCIFIANVCNLVTKEHYYDKPTLDSLHRALTCLRKGMDRAGAKKVAMPKIGCGLDRLNWEDVEKAILEVFRGSDIEIMVCEI